MLKKSSEKFKQLHKQEIYTTIYIRVRAKGNHHIPLRTFHFRHFDFRQPTLFVRHCPVSCCRTTENESFYSFRFAFRPPCSNFACRTKITTLPQ